MSITAGVLSEPDKIFKKSFHQRNDSGELDVFEAARYFSGSNEVSGVNLTQKMMREDKKQAWTRGGRISLDIPTMSRHSIPAQTHHVKEKPMKEKKYKQPNSPGGRLAGFLNSLFNQTSSSKKKKSKSSSTQSMKDEDESPGGRRKRRSSISNFRSGNSSTTADSKSIYSSSSNSGFRTPPPNANTPKNNYKDFRSCSDHKPVLVTTLSKNNGHVKPVLVTTWSKNNGHVKSTALQNEFYDNKKNKDHNAWVDEKFKFSTTNGFSEKYKTFGNPSEEREFRKFNEMDDDGADSDSSSDLFELQNYDLGCCYSSGLPVYETTHMDSIKRGAPIASAAI